jgi:Flp pilus assembly protein TadG
MMIPIGRMSSLLRIRGVTPRRFGANEKGVSAVEFALILPMMALLYLGSVEVGDGFAIKRKVTHVTSSMADLVTQSKSISNADMTNILAIAKAMMTPYNATNLKLKVTGVTIDSNGKATVTWSDALHDTARTKGSTVTLPADVNQKSSFIVMAEGHFSYKPAIGYVLTGTLDLQDTFYLSPRLSDTVARTS